MATTSANNSPSLRGDVLPGKRLVVMMPALNEEATIAEVIEAIPRQIEGVGSVKVVVIDDGSTDRTAELAESVGAKVVRHTVNRGVGAALATGLDCALGLGADVIVNMDSDGQFNPADIPALIRPILDEGYGFVTCTRFGGTHSMDEMPPAKRWGNRMMCRIVNAMIGGGNFTDVSCGFRAYSRETALRLVLFGKFTYTQEMFIDLASKNVAMTEVALPVRAVREHGESRVANSLVRYARRASLILVRSMRDTRPLTFFGLVAILLLLVGIGLFGFVAVWWVYTGRTSPWTSLLTLGTSCLVAAISSGVMALLADQIGRGRRIQEQTLYFQRRQYYNEMAREAVAEELAMDASASKFSSLG